MQNLRKAGDLALVEGLLRGDDRVRVLLRVAQRGGDLAALEDVAVDRERDLRRADQRARRRPRSRRGPSRRAWPGSVSTIVLTVTCSPSAVLAEDERQHLLGRAWSSFSRRVGVEQAAVGVGRTRDLLLAVGDATEQLELGVGAADELLEALGHPAERILRAGGDVGGVDDQRGLAHRALDALDELLLALDVLRAPSICRICSSIAESEVVCLRLVYFSVLSSSRRSDEHPLVGFEDDAQLVLARAVHPDLVGRVRVLRGDEVDGSSRCGPWTWSSSLKPNGKSWPFLA